MTKLEKCQENSISLVLSGGGFRGAFHIGVLAYLDDNGIKIDEISGTSIGALIGSSYASGVSPPKILQLFESKKFKEMFRFNFSLTSLYKIVLDSEVLDQFFLVKNIEELKIPMSIAYLSLDDEEIVYAKEGSIVDTISKSTAYFPFFEAKSENEKLYVDGGYLDNLPYRALKKRDLVLSVDLHPSAGEFSKHFFGKLKKIAYILWHKNINESIQKSDYYITDEKLEEYSIVRQNSNSELFDLGYKSARDYFSLQEENS